MAPRSARKRKSVDGDGGANGGVTPNPTSRRRKREDAAEREEVAVESSGSSCTSELKMMELSAVDEGEEGAEKTQEAALVLSALDESQLLETMDDAASNELSESLLSMMEDTQGGTTEMNDMALFTLGEEEGEGGETSDNQQEAEGAMPSEPLTGHAQLDEEDEEADGVGAGDASEDDESRQSLAEASASIEDILLQLSEVANHFMTNYRELAAEGDAIQAELNQLSYEQEARCDKMLGRLQRAGESIFSFGQPQEDGGDTQADASISHGMPLA